jgi:nitroimidazol reductase NimA-like FMN-containing flavoprotein (pyridoxamine 5'-phosphate oxidase superfamily)
VSWGDFEHGAPKLAAEGRRLLHRDGIGQGLLATVRDDASPRIHPIWFAIADGRLYAFIGRSAKRVDLERDGRFALHNHVDPDSPSEFSVRGRAQVVEDAAVRSAVAADWAFEVDETYRLFELEVEAVVLGARGSPDDWPPRYASWTAGALPT